MIPGQKPGVFYAVIEILRGQVERVEIYPTRKLAGNAAIRIAVVELFDKVEARRQIEEESVCKQAHQLVQIVPVHEASYVEKQGVPYLVSVKPKKKGRK